MKKPVSFVVAFLLLAIAGWAFLPSLLRTTDSARNTADRILHDELLRAGVRADAFTFAGTTRSGFDWILTWRSLSAPSAEVGVTITPFEADVWGKPVIPNCNEDRTRTTAAFGEICIAKN